MKNLRILICGLFFFCTGLVYGQAKYEHFVIDTTELYYNLKWKDYLLDSLGDVMINYQVNKVKLAQPLLDQIRRLITDRLPANISDRINLSVAITYSRTGNIVNFLYSVNVKALHLFPESLLLDISKLLLTLHTDYPILEYIEKRWQEPSFKAYKRRTGNTVIILKLYVTNNNNS